MLISVYILKVNNSVNINHCSNYMLPLHKKTAFRRADDRIPHYTIIFQLQNCVQHKCRKVKLGKLLYY